MSTEDPSDDADLVHCHECGAKIRRSAEVCTECGVRQTGTSSSAAGEGTNATRQDDEYVHCHECGAEIKRSAEICTECGVRQKTPSQSTSGHHTTQSPAAETQTQQTTPEETTLTDEYSLFQWIGSAVVALVTFPVGLVVPAYLYYKAQNGTGKQQSGLETWTAILFGILGIIAVEIGGRTAAKLLWGLFVVVIALALVAILGV